MIRKLWFIPVFLAGLSFICGTVRAEEVTLMDKPVKVTATVRALEEGGIDARFAVHNGPIAHLVNSILSNVGLNNAEPALRKQLSWQDPYLIVHSSCSVNSVRRCGGDVVFKISDGNVIRLGDFIITEHPVFIDGRFYDGYDKLGEQIGFTIVMTDVNNALQVDADATWASNADVWKIRAAHIASTQPASDWSDAEWEKYFDAVMNNAALARYCNRREELDRLMNKVNPLLDADHRRQLADNLSKVTPLEKPKAWRKAF